MTVFFFTVGRLVLLGGARLRVGQRRLGDHRVFAQGWLHVSVFWAVVLGLVAGKTVRIGGTAAAARRLGFGRAPAGVSSVHIRGGAAMAEIGFTVSLLIAGLAFESGTSAERARMGILAGSMASAFIGSAALVRARGTARRSST